MGKREQRQVAYAVVELEDARSELRSALRPPDRGGRPAAGQPLDTTILVSLRLVEDALGRLEGTDPAAAGLAVSQAAEYLGVSEPTVRAWLKRGLLDRVPGNKPLLVERSSLRRIHRSVAELRAHGQDRDWLGALVDLLRDHTDRQGPEVTRGLDELRRGELEPA